MSTSPKISTVRDLNNAFCTGVDCGSAVLVSFFSSSSSSRRRKGNSCSNPAIILTAQANRTKASQCVNSRTHCGANFSVQSKVGVRLLLGRLAVENDKPRSVLLRQQWKACSRIDNKRRADHDKKVAGK